MKHDFMNFSPSTDPMLPGDEKMLTIAEDMEANGCTLAGVLLFVLVQNLYHQGSSPPDFRLQEKTRLFACLKKHITWICCKFVVIFPYLIIQSQHH